MVKRIIKGIDGNQESFQGEASCTPSILILDSLQTSVN